MARSRSPNREKAFKIFRDKKGEITSEEIAKILDEKVSNINCWRRLDRWKDRLKGKIGAPYANKNAINNNGGAPKKNQNNRKHGFYSKYLPAKVFDIFQDIESMDTLDILWNNIKLKYAAIINAQEIMFVKDQEDMTKELKKFKSQKEVVEGEEVEVYREEEYEIQFAWDKQANFLRAQSTAMGQLTNMIKKYEELLHTNWDTVTEEQKLRVERLKVQIENPELQHRKEVAEKKHEFEKEKFEHAKEMDELKAW